MSGSMLGSTMPQNDLSLRMTSASEGCFQATRMQKDGCVGWGFNLGMLMHKEGAWEGQSREPPPLPPVSQLRAQCVPILGHH